MPPLSQRMKIAAYAAFGVLCTLFFVYQTFPIEAVQGRVQRELEKSAPVRLSFARASPWRLSGLEMEDVNVVYGADPQNEIRMSFDRVRARVQILPLIFKSYNVTYDIKLGDGELSGEVRNGEKSTGFALEADGVDLAHPPLLAKAFSLPSRGELNAKIDLDLDNDPKKTSGRGSIELKKAGTTADFQAHGLTVPAIDLGALTANFEVKDGVMLFKNFSQKSGDLETKVSGEISLRRQLMTSGLNLGLMFKLSDAYTQRNPTLQLMLGILKNNKTPDGFYNIKFTGTLATPFPNVQLGFN